MLLKIKHRPDVDNLRNYPAEIIKELEELRLRLLHAVAASLGTASKA
jgi:hypothetical protein